MMLMMMTVTVITHTVAAVEGRQHHQTLLQPSPRPHSRSLLSPSSLWSALMMMLRQPHTHSLDSYMGKSSIAGKGDMEVPLWGPGRGLVDTVQRS